MTVASTGSPNNLTWLEIPTPLLNSRGLGCKWTNMSQTQTLLNSFVLQQTYQKLSCGWGESASQGGSLTWLWVGGLGFPPQGHFHRALWVTSQQEGWLSSSETQDRARRRAPPLGSHILPFLHHPTGSTALLNVSTRRWHSLGPSWRLATTVTF